MPSRILNMLCQHYIQQNVPSEQSRFFTGTIIDNKHYSPIDSSLVTNMQLAPFEQKAKQKAVFDEREEKDGTFQIKDRKKKTKRDAAEIIAKMADKASLKYQQILEQAQKPSGIGLITTPTEKPFGKSPSACKKRRFNVEGESNNAKKKVKHFIVMGSSFC